MAQGQAPPPVIVAKSPLTLQVVELAGQGAQGAQDQLRSRLTDRAFLAQLNTPQEYLALEPTNLQLYFILETLARNEAPGARALLGELAASPIYMSPGAYLAALLEASVHARNPAPGLVALWDAQLAPDGSELQRAVDVVVANGSPQAIDTLERRLLRNEYREDYVVAWLRSPVLRHRQDLPLLQASARLLEAPGWPSRLKQFLVEALFDYDREHWYQSEVQPPEPPSRAALTADSRAALERIAQIGRDQSLLGRSRYREIQSEIAVR